MSERTRSPVPSLPGLLEIEAGNGLCVTVTWKSGSRAEKRELVDLSPFLSLFKLYRPVRENRALFESIHLIEDGRVAAWGDNDEIDMPASRIERLAEEMMTKEDFKIFLKRHDLTHAGAAAKLGRSRRQIENYLSGEKEIPRIVVLACFGLDARKEQATARNAPLPANLEDAEEARVSSTNGFQM